MRPLTMPASNMPVRFAWHTCTRTRARQRNRQSILVRETPRHAAYNLHSMWPSHEHTHEHEHSHGGRGGQRRLRGRPATPATAPPPSSSSPPPSPSPSPPLHTGSSMQHITSLLLSLPTFLTALLPLYPPTCTLPPSYPPADAVAVAIAIDIIEHLMTLATRTLPPPLCGCGPP